MCASRVVWSGSAMKPVARVVGEFRRLGLDMGALGAERVHRRQIKVRQDVQKQDRGRALAVRRMFDQFDALIGAGDGGGVVAGGGGQIVQRVGAAKRPQRGDHVLGHLAFVEPGAALLGDAAQDFGLPGRAEDLADGRAPGRSG